MQRICWVSEWMLSYAYWTVHHCDSWRLRDQLDITVYEVYFTASMPNMFRTLIHPSSGTCDFSIVSPHWSCVLVSICVGVSVWLGWSGSRVAGCSLLHGYHPNQPHRLKPATRIPSQPATRIPPQPATPKLQHTSKQEHTTSVVIQ